MSLESLTTSLVVAGVLGCALVAGFLFAFAVVVMPGIRRLADAEFIRVFQAIDGVIQRGSVPFVLAWSASAVLPLLAAVVRFVSTDGPDAVLVASAAAVMILGVHLPTVVVNVPANNRLQAVNLDDLDHGAVEQARRDFEGRWVRWNLLRTVMSGVAVLLLSLALALS